MNFIFRGGVYGAENTDRHESVELFAIGGQRGAGRAAIPFVTDGLCHSVTKAVAPFPNGNGATGFQL
jgi:hypothetical protein